MQSSDSFKEIAFSTFGAKSPDGSRLFGLQTPPLGSESLQSLYLNLFTSFKRDFNYCLTKQPLSKCWTSRTTSNFSPATWILTSLQALSPDPVSCIISVCSAATSSRQTPRLNGKETSFGIWTIWHVELFPHCFCSLSCRRLRLEKRRTKCIGEI